MAQKRTRKRIVLAELEASYGVAETLVAADTVRSRNFQLDAPYAGEKITRNLDRSDLGIESSININPHKGCSFEVELTPSGAAGTAPPYADLLKACGWAETIDPGVSVIYNPVADPTDSVTLGMYLDGEYHLSAGARGTWEIHWVRGIPFMRFSFMGFYATPTGASPPTPDFSAYNDPYPMTNTNTPTVTIGAFNAVLQSLTAIGNLNPIARNVPNQEEILQTDRQVQGQIVIDRPDIALKDIYSDAVESHDGLNTNAVQIVHGVGAGNIITFDAPVVQLEDVNDGDDSGLAISTFPARYIPDSGDDEVTLTFT